MMEHLPVLLVAVPLMTALVSPLLSILSKSLSQIFIKAALLLNLVLSVLVLREVVLSGPWHYWMGSWEPPYGIEFVIDAVSGSVVVVATLMAFLVAVYAQPFFKTDASEREPRSLFYVLFLLMVTGVIGVAVAGDIFTMYVFIEITSISAYGLVALGGAKAVLAAFRYLIIGTAAASFYLIGIGFLFSMTGTLNIEDLSHIVPSMMDSTAMIFSVIMILLAFGIKSAVVPLHSWLPDAHTYGPTPAIAYLATAMLKVFAYGIFRFMFTIFGGYSNETTAAALTILGVLAAIGIIYGSVMAIAQTDFRRMLAYSTIAQLSYIPLGLAIGTPLAIAAAVFQIASHSLTKGCLFMIKGSMHVKLHTTQIEKLKGMCKTMPICSAALAVAALSMIGLPPTSGFFVKWQLVSESAAGGKYFFIAVLIASSLLNAVYFFRVLENVLFKDVPDAGAQDAAAEHAGAEDDDSHLTPAHPEVPVASEHPDSHLTPAHPEVPAVCARYTPELPLRMLAPIVVLALLILAAGLGSGWIMDNILSHIVLPGGGA